MMQNIKLIEKTHQYLVKGIPVISVTQVIDARYSCSPWYAEKGKYIHKMCELYKKGRLDESTLDEQLIPYLEAFKMFEIDAPHVKGIIDYKSGVPEKWHKLQLAAYRELWLNGVDKVGEPLRNITKGQEVMGYHPVYSYAGTIDVIDLEFTFMPPSPSAYALYLEDTGKYKLRRAENIRKHTQAFLTLVSGMHIREQYGISG